MEQNELPVQYDMSFSTNTRINYLLWNCNQALEQDDPLQWFKSLKNILKEVSTSTKDEDYTNHEDQMKKIEKSITEFQIYMGNYAKIKNSNAPFAPPRECFDLLLQWEITLRKKLDKMGLLFKRGDDAYSAMV